MGEEALKPVTSQERLDAMFAFDPYKVEREPYPAPGVTSREEHDFLMPNAVLKLAEMAREAGWEVHTQHSRGRMPHSVTGEPGALYDFVGMRFSDHPMNDRRAFAVIRRPASGTGVWTWDNTMIWGPKLIPFAGCSITDLKAFLIMPDASDYAIDEYVYTIKQIASNAEALRKAREAARKAILRRYDELTGQMTGCWVSDVLRAVQGVADVRQLGAGVLDDEQILTAIERRKSGTKEGFR